MYHGGFGSSWFLRQVGVERSTVCFAVPSQEQPAATTAAAAGSHRLGKKKISPPNKRQRELARSRRGRPG
jgi:hypothetical protein